MSATFVINKVGACVGEGSADPRPPPKRGVQRISMIKLTPFLWQSRVRATRKPTKRSCASALASMLFRPRVSALSKVHGMASHTAQSNPSRTHPSTVRFVRPLRWSEGARAREDVPGERKHLPEVFAGLRALGTGVGLIP